MIFWGKLWRVVFASWNLLYVNFSLCETCILIFSSWNWFCLWSQLSAGFSFLEPTDWFFVHETCCMLIWLFVKLAHLYLSPWNSFCPQNWLFVEFFCSRSFLHVYFSLHETCTLIFCSWNWFCFSNLLLADFYSGTSCVLISFVKLVVICFFSSWYLYIEFYPRETDFIHGTYFVCCILIFFLETLCVLIFLWNLLHVDFPFREACTLIFLFMKLIFPIELVACWFVVHVFWWLLIFCYWILLHIDFSLRESCKLVLSSLNLFYSWSLLCEYFSSRKLVCA